MKNYMVNINEITIKRPTTEEAKILDNEVKILKEKVGFNRVYENILRTVAEVKDIIPYEYRRFYILIVCVRYLHMIERKDIKSAYITSVRRLNSEGRQW